VKYVLPAPQVKLFEKAVEWTVFLTASRKSETYTGTGVVVSSEGLILTALHVVEGRNVTVHACRCRLDERGVRVRTYGKYLADIVDKDRQADIALLKLRHNPNEELKVASLGNSNELKMGSPLYRIGNDFDGRNLGMGRIYYFGHDDKCVPEFRVSMNNDSGASGGPIFDRHRRLLGILLCGEESELLPPFASVIPINEVKRRLLEKHGLCRAGAKISGPWKKR
jgi:S1-C subfamily serine protease